jgi:hypothetical protein
LHPVDFLFPDGCAEPDLETVDAKAAPFRSKEVTELVDKNDDIENRQDDDDQQDHQKDCGNVRHGKGKNCENLAKPDLQAS